MKSRCPRAAHTRNRHCVMRLPHTARTNNP
jgi:hypothetical protein